MTMIIYTRHNRNDNADINDNDNYHNNNDVNNNSIRNSIKLGHVPL